MDNATLLLQIDNAKLAEDDFKNKYTNTQNIISQYRTWNLVCILSDPGSHL